MEWIVVFAGLLLLLGGIGAAVDSRRTKKNQHHDHIHSIHSLGKPYVLESHKKEIIVGEYTFKIRWRQFPGNDEHFVAFAYRDDELIHAKIFESVADAERWVSKRAAFLGKTTYTVEKELV